MEEKRRHPRFRISQMLTLQQNNERVIHAQGVNISRSGLCCSTTERMQPGSTAYVILELQDHGVPRVSAEAVVVWCDPREGGYDAGLVFRTLYENSARALDQFLSPREAEQ
jgi:Tfp pilus assembly protein PilZ